MTLNNGTLYLWRVNTANALIVNGGTLLAENGFGNTWSGPITLNATLNCNISYHLTCSGDIGGPDGLNKTGGATMILSGNNSYAGPTTITAGTLQCNNPDALGSGALSVSSGGAKVNLNYSGTKTIASLTLGEGGVHVITAQYVGDPGSAPSTSATLTQTVVETRTATTTTLTSGTNPSNQWRPVTFTATVSAGATGGVTFYDGTTALGTATLNGSAQASAW